MQKRRSPEKVALQIAKYVRAENPDYGYLRNVFMHLRHILNVQVTTESKKLPYVPSEDEIKRYYESVWQSNNIQDVMIIKVLLYTGIRVSELIKLEKSDVDTMSCQIRVEGGKGKKDRIVPFPKSFRETLVVYIAKTKKNVTSYLFESNQKKPYSDRGIRRILEKYSQISGIEKNISPRKLRQFLFTWLKKQGIEDALIQAYSGHETHKSLEVYSKLSLAAAQDTYEKNIKTFPV